MNNIPNWFYNDLKQTGVDLNDISTVINYNRSQKSSTPETERALIEKLGILQNNSVIDFGAGTGTFAIQAALRGAVVYAVDVSEAMLVYAENEVKKANIVNIEFHHSGFLTYQHQAEPVDFIVTKFALHHLPDFWKMAAFVRIASMLKDDGIFYLRDAIFSFPNKEDEHYINAWIRRVAKPDGEGWTPDDFETQIREEYSTFAWIIEGMLQRAGFEIVEVDYPAPEYAEYICKKIANSV